MPRPPKTTSNFGSSGKSKTNKGKTRNATKNPENIILTKIDLERALQDLRFIDQMVLVYHFIDGQKLDEVVERLNRNQSATKYSLDGVVKIEQRALSKLRKKMGKE